MLEDIYNLNQSVCVPLSALTGELIRQLLISNLITSSSFCLPAARKPGGAVDAYGTAATSDDTGVSGVVMPLFGETLMGFGGELTPSGSDCTEETPSGSLFSPGTISAASIR